MKHRGLAQIPLMIGLLLMAVALPVATKLVQDNQDNRNKAYEPGECVNDPDCGSGYYCDSGTCKRRPTSPPTRTSTVAPECKGIDDAVHPYTEECCSGLMETDCSGSGSNKICVCVRQTGAYSCSTMGGTCRSEQSCGCGVVDNATCQGDDMCCKVCPTITIVPTAVPTVTGVVPTLSDGLLCCCIGSNCILRNGKYCLYPAQKASNNSSCNGKPTPGVVITAPEDVTGLESCGGLPDDICGYRGCEATERCRKRQNSTDPMGYCFPDSTCAPAKVCANTGQCRGLPGSLFCEKLPGVFSDCNSTFQACCKVASTPTLVPPPAGYLCCCNSSDLDYATCKYVAGSGNCPAGLYSWGTAISECSGLPLPTAVPTVKTCGNTGTSGVCGSAGGCDIGKKCVWNVNGMSSDCVADVSCPGSICYPDNTSCGGLANPCSKCCNGNHYDADEDTLTFYKCGPDPAKPTPTVVKKCCCPGNNSGVCIVRNGNCVGTEWETSLTNCGVTSPTAIPTIASTKCVGEGQPCSTGTTRPCCSGVGLTCTYKSSLGYPVCVKTDSIRPTATIIPTAIPTAIPTPITAHKCYCVGNCTGGVNNDCDWFLESDEHSYYNRQCQNSNCTGIPQPKVTSKITPTPITSDKCFCAITCGADSDCVWLPKADSYYNRACLNSSCVGIPKPTVTSKITPKVSPTSGFDPRVTNVPGRCPNDDPCTLPITIEKCAEQCCGSGHYYFNSEHGKFYCGSVDPDPTGTTDCTGKIPLPDQCPMPGNPNQLGVNAQCITLNGKKDWDWDLKLCDQKGKTSACGIKNYCCPSVGGNWTTIMTQCSGVCTQCPGKPEAKRQGDADCSGTTDINDASIWRGEFISGEYGVTVRSDWRADFDCDGKVTLNDISIWRENFIKGLTK